MKAILKNNWLVLTMALCAVASLLFLGFNSAKAQPSNVVFEATATATTTRSYLANGGTSTFQFDSNLASSGKVPNVQTVDAASLFIQVEASTTATIYSIAPQFSNNNIDWYGVASSSTNGANAFTAGATSYTWAPGTTATSSLVLLLPAIPAAHERVIVTATGAAGTVYMEADLKKNPSTP